MKKERKKDRKKEKKRKKQTNKQTCIRGQEGLLRCISEFAARAPLRKVGPKLIVMLENLKEKKNLILILILVN